MSSETRIQNAGILNTVAGVSTVAVSLISYSLFTSSFLMLTNLLLRMFMWLAYLTMLAMFVGVFASVLGIRQMLAAKSMRLKDSGTPSLSLIIANVLGEHRYSWALIVSAIAYGIFYAAVSSIIVYRPEQNFAVDYLADIPSMVPTVCCGGPGFIPVFTVYLTEHLGLLIIPANIVLLLIVSGLVGVNGALAIYGYDNRPKAAGAGWFGGFGAITGLFTACPTCAGLFLGSLVQGVGTTAVAAALAAYQPLFVAVTIPLLIASVYFMTRNLRQTVYGSCTLIPSTSKSG